MSQILFTQARQAVATALVSSPDIEAFVSTNFPGKSLRVYREIIPGVLPSAEDCPFVAFGPFTHGQMDKDPHRIEHAMPMGVFLDHEASYAEPVSNLFVVQSAEILDELATLVESVASQALNAAGFAYEQDPYLPDDVSWDQYSTSFYLYRVRTTRRINL